MNCVQAAKLILDFRLGPVRPGADCIAAPSRGWLLPARAREGISCSISALHLIVEMQSGHAHFCLQRSSLGWLGLSSKLRFSSGGGFVSRLLLGGQLPLVYSVGWSLPCQVTEHGLLGEQSSVHKTCSIRAVKFLPNLASQACNVTELPCWTAFCSLITSTEVGSCDIRSAILWDSCSRVGRIAGRGFSAYKQPPDSKLSDARPECIPQSV